MFEMAGVIVLLAAVGSTVTAASGHTRTSDQTIEQVRKEFLQLPHSGVFDFLAFTYDNGTVTLAGFAYRPTLKNDAERAVRRVAGVRAVKDQIKVLPTSFNDDELRWKTYYAIYRDPFLSRYAPGSTK